MKRKNFCEKCGNNIKLQNVLLYKMIFTNEHYWDCPHCGERNKNHLKIEMLNVFMICLIPFFIASAMCKGGSGIIVGSIIFLILIMPLLYEVNFFKKIGLSGESVFWECFSILLMAIIFSKNLSNLNSFDEALRAIVTFKVNLFESLFFYFSLILLVSKIMIRKLLK